MLMQRALYGLCFVLALTTLNFFGWIFVREKFGFRGSLSRKSSSISNLRPPQDNLGTIANLSDERLSFRRENLVDSLHHRCGTWKCLFPLKVNPKLGYVAGADAILESAMLKGWNFSLEIIKKEHGMQHVYLRPPQHVAVDETFREWMDQGKTGTDDRERNDTPYFGNKSTVTVQMVTVMDTAVFFGGSERKMLVGLQQIEAWLRPLLSNREERVKVLDRFESSLAKLYPLLAQHPCLYHDFQVFIRHSGDIVHLDLDRCYQNNETSLEIPSLEFQQDYKRRIESVADFVVAVLMSGEIPSSSEIMKLAAVATENTTPSAASAMKYSPQDKRLAFAQENLLHGVKHRCGTYKCLYPLKSNPQLGYVAGMRDVLGKSMWIAYNFSKNVIEAEYGMQHLALSPPEKVSLSHGFAAWLDQNKTGPNGKPRTKVPYFSNVTTATVQLVDIISLETALFFGCSDKKMIIGWEQMENWLNPILANENELERMNVQRRFQESSRQLNSLLSNHPCMYYDFQIFVRETGEIVHFDVDRCFQTEDLSIRIPEPDIIEDYQGKIEAFTMFVSAALSKGRMPSSLEDYKSPLNAIKNLSPELTFSRANLLDGAGCDNTKCLFPLKTNPRVGYLAVPEETLGKRWQKAWNYSQHVIEKEYGMHHVYLAPPKSVQITELRTWMDRGSKSEQAKVKDGAPQFQSHSAATVQLVEIYSSDSAVLLSCDERKMQSERNQLDAWLQRVLDVGSTEERMSRVHHFERSMAQLLVLNRYHPCLYTGFRVLLQDNGDLKHLDVHRCFESQSGEMLIPPKEDRERCKARLKKVAQHITKTLRLGIMPEASL